MKIPNYIDGAIYDLLQRTCGCVSATLGNGSDEVKELVIAIRRFAADERGLALEEAAKVVGGLINRLYLCEACNTARSHIERAEYDIRSLLHKSR